MTNDKPTRYVSENRSESKKNGLYISDLVPSKFQFILRNGSIVTIDTAWAESGWRSVTNLFLSTSIEKTYGFNILVPLKEFDDKKFMFTFTIDSALNYLSSGLDVKRKRKDFYLIDSIPSVIKIFLEERHFDDSIGWLQPALTDSFMLYRDK